MDPVNSATASSTGGEVLTRSGEQPGVSPPPEATPASATELKENSVERSERQLEVLVAEAASISERLHADINRWAEIRRTQRQAQNATTGLSATAEGKPKAEDVLEGNSPAAAKATSSTSAGQPEEKAEKKAKSGGDQVEEPTANRAQTQQTPPLLPQEVRQDYVQVGTRFYHRDNARQVAFEDLGDVLKTTSDRPENARLMAQIGDVRSWEAVRVKGSAEFKREVWLEATARGIEVSGYRPTKADLAEVQVRLDRYLERNTIEVTARRAHDFRTLSPEEALKRPDLASATVAAEALSRLAEGISDPRLRERLQSGFRSQLAEGMERGDHPRPLDDPRVRAKVHAVEGILLASRAARFHDDPSENMSHVVYIKTENGVVEKWGKEIGPALEAANAEKGQRIRLSRTGATPVQVEGTIRDDNNRVVGRGPLNTHRNEWTVEVLDKERARDVNKPVVQTMSK